MSVYGNAHVLLEERLHDQNPYFVPHPLELHNLWESAWHDSCFIVHYLSGSPLYVLDLLGVVVALVDQSFQGGL